MTIQAISAEVSFTPCLLSPGARSEEQADWAVAGAVAAMLGIGFAVVFYICSVCQARSFDACVNAVVNYWGSGC